MTMAGAMIRAMLAAYRRTLHKTMEQARSMQQVVDQAGLTWLETPDQAVVWGTALGLQGEIEDVLKRSSRTCANRRTRVDDLLPDLVQLVRWLVGREWLAGSGGSIFSGSAVPDLGGMMSALGTIGNSPASSGGGSGGGGGVQRRLVGRWRRAAGGGF